MITVRFATGVAVQYNTATFVKRFSEFSDLYTTDGGAWVAQVPNAALIEVSPACRVYDATRSEPDSMVARELRTIQRKLRHMTSRKR